MCGASIIILFGRPRQTCVAVHAPSGGAGMMYTETARLGILNGTQLAQWAQCSADIAGFNNLHAQGNATFLAKHGTCWTCLLPALLQLTV